MKEFGVSTKSRTEFVDITSQVASALGESGLTSGLCTVFIPHTTAAVTINENADADVARDIVTELNKVIPFDDGYRHAEGNSAAHIKSSLVGCSITVPVEEGRLRLGTWQGIYFCEFDGPRSRRVWVHTG
jgi:secondary thiamine-phosphate synthase enzyme